MQRIAIEDRRSALLAAAVRVVARDGLARASTRAIAAEAGMPTASFHYVFASHDAMVEELVGSILAAQSAAIETAVSDASTLPEFAGSALQGWLDRATADPDGERALHDVIAASRASQDLRHLAITVYEQYATTVAAFVAEAEARFAVRWSVPAEDVARFVLVITDGVAARWLVDRDEAAARRSLATGADALMGLILTARA